MHASLIRGAGSALASAALVLGLLAGSASAGQYSAFNETTHPIDPGVASDDGAIADWSSVVAAANPTSAGGAGSASNVTGAYNSASYSLGDLSESAIDSGTAPGSITLGFDQAITNDAGYDFAVFENGGNFFDPPVYYAELGYVEVSTNGDDFARIPGLSLNEESELNTSFNRAFAGVNTTNLFNLAGKHGGGVGAGFDLDDLDDHSLVTDGAVDLSEINFVRIVDIPGDGSFTDSEGNSIYDAWNSNNSNNTGGMDLQAVGVMNAVPEPTAAALLLGGAGLLALGDRRRSL